MKKLTKEQWEGVKERFYKHIPWTPSYLKPEDAERMDKEILSFFKQELLEDTETPGEEKCLYCEFGHNGKNNPNAGTYFKQEGGRCTQCGATFPQEKGSKPESSWEERFDKYVLSASQVLGDKLSAIQIYNHEESEALTLKSFISKVVSEAEKRAYNLALEEARKKTIEWTDNDYIRNNLVEALRALKK